MQPVVKRRVILYLALLFLFTAAAHLATANSGNQLLTPLIIMWSPALAAIVASLMTRRSLKEIGWRPWPVKWLAAGWLLPLLYAFPAYALVWSMGLGGVPSPTFLERARLTLDMPTEPNWLVIVSAFGFITLVNLVPAMILSLGEEIGWRGFLVPELTKGIGFRRASLLSGVIWGAWHLPGILAGSYGNSDTPLLYRLACFTALVIAGGVIFAWLQMKSGSIWPAAIMHATHNGVIQAFFDRITADTGPTRYFVGEFGIAIVPFAVAIAYLCWQHSPFTQTEVEAKDEATASTASTPKSTPAALLGS